MLQKRAFDFSLEKTFMRLGPNVADVDLNTKNSQSNFGSNGTIQNLIALICFYSNKKLKRTFEIEITILAIWLTQS